MKLSADQNVSFNLRWSHIQHNLGQIHTWYHLTGAIHKHSRSHWQMKLCLNPRTTTRQRWIPIFFVMEWQLRTVHWNSEQVCVCPAPSLLSTTPTFQTIPTNNKKRASNVKENAKYLKKKNKKKNVTDLSNWSIPY